MQNGESSGRAAEKAPSLVQKESGLHQKLGPLQVTMVALGSTIGTGLFLTSALSVKLAGPAVLLSFAIGSIIATPVAWAIAEMSVAYPAAGSFGVHAEMFLGPWAGFAVRYTYWLCLVIVVGSEVAAAAIYCKFWLPDVPSWIWIAAFSLALVLLNAISIQNFGLIESIFAFIKVITIAVFLVLGTALVIGIGFPKIGFANFTAHGGFVPNGWDRVGMAVTMAIFSFLGIEIVGVTAAEAADPAVAVPHALRRTIGFLALTYIGGLALIVAILPWSESNIEKSPFVSVFERAGIPYASHVMNIVVLSAALSSALCNLYFSARLLFSLSRGGYAPSAFGKLNKQGMPFRAVLVSSVGMVAAMLLSVVFKGSAFLFLIGVAFFGGPFIWLMILVTHIRFRSSEKSQHRRHLRFAPPGHVSSFLGIVALLAVLASTWWIPDFHVTLLAGPPWLLFVTLCYFMWRAYRKPGTTAQQRKDD